MINKCYKKPIMVYAVKWEGTEESYEEICKFMEITPIPNETYPTEFLQIDTLEGIMRASVGDYIIKGIQGEFYPCKPDIFEQTYYNLDKRTKPDIIQAKDFRITVMDNETNMVDHILATVNIDLVKYMKDVEYPKELRYSKSRFNILVTERALEIACNVLATSGYRTKIDIDRQSEKSILVVDLEETMRG